MDTWKAVVRTESSKTALHQFMTSSTLAVFLNFLSGLLLRNSSRDQDSRDQDNMERLLLRHSSKDQDQSLSNNLLVKTMLLL